MRILLLLTFCITSSSSKLGVESYLDNRFQIGSYSEGSISFTIYQFSRSNSFSNRIKAKYFARDAYSRFNSWKGGKKVMIACAGAFSTSWDTNAIPEGLCVDNGHIVNKLLRIDKDKNGNSLDGLVIVYGGGSDAGGVAIKDIEHGEVCSGTKCYDIKDNQDDRISFTAWAHDNNATVFQLPLMYSSEYGKNYGSSFYGSKKERRFLAICKGNDGSIYHLIIDIPTSVYMNYAADKVRTWILNNGFSKLYGLLVLDTGGKNILYQYTSGYGKKLADTEIEKATNLLVYYVE